MFRIKVTFNEYLNQVMIRECGLFRLPHLLIFSRPTAFPQKGTAVIGTAEIIKNTDRILGSRCSSAVLLVI